MRKTADERRGLNSRPIGASLYPLRVLHVINDIELAGAENVVLELARHREPDKVVPYVAYLRGRPTLETALVTAGARVEPIGLERAADLPLALFRLARLIRRVRPDIIHTHLLHAEILGGILGHLYSIPVVATVHNLCWDDAGYSAPLRALYRLVARSNRRSIAVVEAGRRKLESIGVAQSRLATIPNGIAASRQRSRAESRRLLNLPDDPRLFVIGTVGNLHRLKNHRLLLDAFARVAEARSGLHLVVIGDGPLRSELASHARRVGLESRVHLPGRIDDASTLLGAFDVYAVSSQTEGASLSLMEAFAAGLPCVATAVGGTPDLVGYDEPAALLVPPDAAAMASALEQLIEDQALRAHLSALAQRRVGPLSAQAMADAYASLYADILGPASREILSETRR